MSTEDYSFELPDDPEAAFIALEKKYREEALGKQDRASRNDYYCYK